MAFEEEPVLNKYLRPSCLPSHESILSVDRVWMPDKSKGFVVAHVKERSSGELLVKHMAENGIMEETTISTSEVEEMNPPSFDYCEDMSTLTHLNDASILYNLKNRYEQHVIHTFSGLFCVSVNPWQRLPIYTREIMKLYNGAVTDLPPHVYAIANRAYLKAITDGIDQSILITGESGAGKTENTKKIIEYLTVTGGCEDQEELETQICNFNPILESFGNAKTTMNDNSSRFGKFIRIHMNARGKVSGASVETYLLEKSRIVSQNANERSYHIFYQLLAGADEELKEQLNLTKSPDEYKFINQGDSATCSTIDDAEEMNNTNNALAALQFSSSDVRNLYELVAIVLLLGEIRFTSIGMDACINDGVEEAKRVCSIMQCKTSSFINAFIEPKSTVAMETVKRNVSKSKAEQMVGACAKSIYGKLFDHIVARCNQTMNTTCTQFIGVLDIAGFEILTLNSFEQLCINLTNERLQQFFNHFMFIREQAEYEAENIEWDYIDFGLDLQDQIDLIEKPLGVLSLLEEEGNIPRGSELSYVEKLHTQHDGVSSKYARCRPNRNEHFIIEHYAGNVAYDVTNWLAKNKDPLNNSIVDELCNAGHTLLHELFKPTRTRRESMPAPGYRKGVGMGFMTVSNTHKQQLASLMTTLNKTQPHFVRCLVPNEERRPRLISGPLVLHQLKCNGVLEGIRICRRGYPNRLLFTEFKHRYAILCPTSDSANTAKEACEMIIEETGLQTFVDYQIGLTKIFCRVGVVARLEAERNARISSSITALQAAIRRKLECTRVEHLLARDEAMRTVQRNVQYWTHLTTWPWLRLFVRCKAMIKEGDSETITKLQEERADLESQLQRVRVENERLCNECSEMESQIDKVLSDTSEQETQMGIMTREMLKQELLMEELQRNCKRQENAVEELSEARTSDEQRLYEMTTANKELETTLAQMQQSLAVETKARQAIEESKTHADEEIATFREQLHAVQSEKESMQATVTQANSLIQRNNDNEQRMHKLQVELREQNQLIIELTEKLTDERSLRRKAEKARDQVQEDFDELDEMSKKLHATAQKEKEDNKRKEKELSRLYQLNHDTKAQLEGVINDMRLRHSKTNAQLKSEKDDCYRLNVKLESENKRQKGEIESLNKALTEAQAVDRTDYSSLRRNRVSRRYSSDQMASSMSSEYSSLPRRQSSTALLTKRIDDLEREKRTEEARTRALQRELNMTNKSLQEETDEKTNAYRELRMLRQDLEKNTHKIRGEEAWKLKCEKMVIEEDVDALNKTLKSKLTIAERVIEDKDKTVHQLEKQEEQLNSQLHELGCENGRLVGTVATLEKLQRTQEQAVDRWDSQYKVTIREMDALRDENQLIRTKMRRLNNQLETLKDVCHENDIPIKEQPWIAIEEELRSETDEIRIPRHYRLDKCASVSTIGTNSSNSTFNSYRW